MRVLILSTTTGYQLRAFDDAAAKLGFELVFATDRCDHLEDPWRDRAIPVRFHDESGSLRAIVEATRDRRVDGVIALGDRPVVLAAICAERLGLPGHPQGAARISTSKLLTRQALERAGLSVPWYFAVSVGSEADAALARARFPCVVKPLSMAASRGVMRADDARSFREAFGRVRTLLLRREVRAQRNEAHRFILIEGYIPGAEYAVEGVVRAGRLHAVAIFDKPDPLEGPFFEETIYVTPSRLPQPEQDRILEAVATACRAVGLTHGAVHAEVRVNPTGMYVLEVAPRPIGGLCARALRFMGRDECADGPEDASAQRPGGGVSLEELLLLHAIGAPVDGYVRESQAAGVMMIPVPRAGLFKGIERLAEARSMSGIDDIVITAKRDQMLVPLPEGASYPGFIFARGGSPRDVELVLRQAHATLGWVIERPIELAPDA